MTHGDTIIHYTQEYLDNDAADEAIYILADQLAYAVAFRRAQRVESGNAYPNEDQRYDATMVTANRIKPSITDSISEAIW